MNKKTLILISDLNNLYDSLFKVWSTKKWDDILEIQNKLKLIKVITKNIVEQSRWFLKSKLDYSKAGYHILENISNDYNSIHKWINNILLHI